MKKFMVYFSLVFLLSAFTEGNEAALLSFPPEGEDENICSVTATGPHAYVVSESSDPVTCVITRVYKFKFGQGWNADVYWDTDTGGDPITTSFVNGSNPTDRYVYIQMVGCGTVEVSVNLYCQVTGSSNTLYKTVSLTCC